MDVRSTISILHRPFNLVELVIILTTLLSLASFLLPAVYNAGQHAESILCSSNQKTLGTWVSMYTHASDEYLPAYEQGWVQRITAMGGRKVDPHAPPKKELSCPSQAFVSPVSGISAADYWRGTYFGLNEHLVSQLKSPYGDPLPAWGQAQVNQIRDVSRKVLAADASGSNYFGIPGRDPVIAGLSRFGESFVDSLPPDPIRPFPSLRHLNGTGNFLFLDGHVELKNSWPVFMLGPGTSGYDFWHAEHWYPGSGMKKPHHSKFGRTP